jgi:UDPglucose 6-dehydrogenase
MVGDLATKIGANPDKVLHAVGSDSRINNKFFRYGFGWGGPCFPRDTRAYMRLAKNNDMPFDMCEASTNINDKHLHFQIEQFLNSGQSEYFTDSVTYKKGTVILEESQQLRFAYALAKSGIKVTIQESDKVIKILKESYGDVFNYVGKI